MTFRKILISPLNWGFGHTGRMIPLANALKRMGHDVIFAVDKEFIPMIKNEVPGISIIELKGIRIRYSRFLPQYLMILLQIPHMAAASFREHHALKIILKKFRPDIVISDNRFGLFNKSVCSVYVTHQLRIPFPLLIRFLEPLGIVIHRILISQFDMCLIPDFPGEINLSGKLSHGVKTRKNTFYTGPLSRFSQVRLPASPAINEKSYRCLVLSGPEPQRSLLMERVMEVSGDQHLVILSGGGDHYMIKTEGNVTFVTNASAEEMLGYIVNSSLVISRSGYTTIMELLSINKGAIIVPTPGQTEQEYLGRYLNGRFGFVTVRQKEIGRLKDILPLYHESCTIPESRHLLDHVLRVLSEKVKE